MPTVTDLTGPAGRLEGLLEEPAQKEGVKGPKAAVVFAHPHPQHGGTMHTKVVYQGAKGLSRIGCVVLRFNFRGVGASQGTFDGGHGEMDDFRAAIDYMTARYPDTKLWAAGFSFGSWVALEAGAADDRVTALIGIAPPVATSISGMAYEFTRTLASTKPKFFVQGEADEVCPLEGMWTFYAKLHEPKELVVVDGADHLFEGKTQEVGEALEDLLADFEG
jgi:alpha/beta superfamily hydrolase